MPRDHRLTLEQRQRICQLLAAFERPRAVCRTLAREFGISEPSEQNIYRIRSSAKWRPLIEAYREELVKAIREIPVANKVHRLRVIDRELRIACHWYTSRFSEGHRIKERSFTAITSLLRLAAEEMGDLKVEVEHGPQEHIFRIVEQGADKPAGDGSAKSRA